MRTRKKWLILLAASVLGTLTVSACAPTASAPTPAPTKAVAAAPTKAPEAAPTKAAEPAKPPAPTATPRPATVKYGSLPGVFNAALYFANDKGHFKEQGINIEFVDFRTIQELIAPVGTGQLDVVGMPLSTPLLAAADRGVDLRLVAALSVSAQPSNNHTWIMLRKDLKDSGQVKTPADLNGMKVAMPSQGGLGDQTVLLMLAQAGLKAEDVEMVVLPAAEQAAAFANKAIAAGYTLEPQISDILQKGLADKWIPISQYYGGKVQTGVIIFGPNMLKDQDLARRWMTGYVKGAREYLKAAASRDGRADAVNALTNHTPLKDPKAYETMELPTIDINGQPDKQNIDTQYKYWVEGGFYKGQTTIEKITDLSYLDYAIQRIGRQ